MTISEAIDRGICVKCGKYVHYDGSGEPTGEPGQIYTEAGWDEFQTCGKCETCLNEEEYHELI